jgi:hypothetical protein
MTVFWAVLVGSSALGNQASISRSHGLFYCYSVRCFSLTAAATFGARVGILQAGRPLAFARSAMHGLQLRGYLLLSVGGA